MRDNLILVYKTIILCKKLIHNKILVKLRIAMVLIKNRVEVRKKSRHVKFLSLELEIKKRLLNMFLTKSKNGENSMKMGTKMKQATTEK